LAARPITLKVLEAASPAGVERNGIRLPHLTTQNDFNAASLAWFYDGSAFLHVKFAHSGGNVTVKFGPPDSVGDGVTDSWRQYWNVTDDTVDTDNDGMTNAQEYAAGTNPNDPNSRFSIQSVTPQSNGFQVAWPSQLGLTYRAQWKNLMTDPTWQTITPDFTGSGSILTWLDDGTQTGGFTGSRFYRVAIP
jgi:hypothetical protein